MQSPTPDYLAELEQSPIAKFARWILHRPLYWYQIEICNAILDSINQGHGYLITVMMARQQGKNQLSAILEAFLLVTRTSGTIVKAAPTFSPQVLNSRLRLMAMLNAPMLRQRIWTSYGMIGLAPRTDKALLKRHIGPRVMLFSAGEDSNVVGATADLLLEIDESQDVTPLKFDRDFRPMASTTNSTTVLYGTAWSDDTLLAQQQAVNLEIEERTGVKRHFAYDWRVLAAINPNYKKFVESEIARMGAEHPTILTQYMLQPITGAGYYLNPLQRAMLQGKHLWEDAPVEDALYVAGIDVAGEADRLMPGETMSPTRDSTIVTIGKVRYNEIDLPMVEIVHQVWWTGVAHTEQYAMLVQLAEIWNLRRMIIDKTGLGAGLASLLVARFGDERVTPFAFTRPSKSKLAYQMIALINAGRMKMYAEHGAPHAVFTEAWSQLREAKYTLPAAETMNFFVPREHGHDDFLMSTALLGEAIEGIPRPPLKAAFIKARKMYPGESRY